LILHLDFFGKVPHIHQLYTTPIPENWSSGSMIAWLIFENEQETDCSTSAFLGEF